MCAAFCLVFFWQWQELGWVNQIIWDERVKRKKAFWQVFNRFETSVSASFVKTYSRCFTILYNLVLITPMCPFFLLKPLYFSTKSD